MTTYATVSIECPNCVRLRQDLAAARELLHEARDWMPAYSMRDRIDAFLAQRDPTASKDHDLERNE
jgi:hypothetical protein